MPDHVPPPSPALFDIEGLRWTRENALTVFAPWKIEINVADMVATDKWEILWPDETVEASEPLVENTYLQALEDKTYAAGTVLPRLMTIAKRGTRQDQAERQAAKRKRVYSSYWDRSALHRQAKKFYRDGLHTGAAYGMPWCNWQHADGTQVPPAERFPYFMKVDPRQVFPLAHDEKDRLTAGIILRQRRVRDLKRSWPNNPVLNMLIAQGEARFGREPEWFEELWVMDEHHWGVAIGDSALPPQWQGVPVAPNEVGHGVTQLEWVHPPEEHRLMVCPLVEMRRVTVDDWPRGALIDIVPQLKTAQNFMARLLEDLEMNIYAPVVLDNIQNTHEYGMGAVLLGTGQGKANILRDRPPVNFEAQQTVASIIEQTRRQAFEPAQRSGSPEASIVSAKGVNALMGTFNSELASMQQDFETFVAELSTVTANFDEMWGVGRKAIWGFDASGEPFDESYDPTVVFDGDYRVNVSYGERTGLDDNNFMIRLATMMNLGGMSRRSFIAKSGSAEDPLQEERDITIEQLTDLFMQGVLPQQIQSGDLASLKSFVDKIDDDKMTTRAAVLETIREMTEAVPEAEGQMGAGGRADIMKLIRSISQGGIPGQAEGQPQAPGGPGGQPVLPGPARRQLAQGAPGGTAT